MKMYLINLIGTRCQLSGVAALKQCKQVLTFLQHLKKIILGYFVQIQTELPHLVVF